MTNSKIALFVGDISLDTTLLVDHVPEPDEKVLAARVVEDCGGVVANAAIACRLAGHASAMLCVLGDDPAAATCLSRLDDRGVAIHHTRSVGLTTRALITLDATGEKRLVLAPGVSMYPTMQACRTVDLRSLAWVHTALYDVDAAAALIARCRRSGVPWSIDLEPATLGRGLAAISSCLEGAEVVFINSRAGRLLGTTPERHLFDAGVREVIRTEGPAGAQWCTPTERVAVEVPAVIGTVVDSTGAGDCLAGSFVAQRLQGSTPESALRYAVTAASLSCTQLGGHSSYQSPAAVRALLVPTKSTSPCHTSSSGQPEGAPTP